MNIKKSHIYNSIALVVVILMIVPQTRKSIQIGINQVKALFAPGIHKTSEKEVLTSYQWILKDDMGLFYDFHNAQGKVVFVNLWATWCPPCIAEMPNIEKLYQEYQDRVQFLLVTHEEQKTVLRFLEKRQLQIPFYQPQTKSPEELSSTSIPATFIIGKDGTIHVDELGAANWNSHAVRELLDSLLKE